MFDPLDYDVYHLGASGGKDSTAALLWLVYESGWPVERLQVTFCDTGNEDPLTYAYLDVLSRAVHPIQTLRPERDFWELARWKGRFPSRKAQFCTQWLKIIPTRTFVRDLTRQGCAVLALNGIRAAEGHASNQRGQLPLFEFDAGFGCDVYRPVLDWSIEAVWDIHRRYLDLDAVLALVDQDAGLSRDNKRTLKARMHRHGIPRNPLYDAGARRVGCFPCINARKAEVRALARYRPERVDFIASQEGSFDNGNMYSTLFARKTVPEAHRSQEITTAAGEVMRVATIRDVVRWSHTAYGGRQFEMDLDVGPASACDLGGLCE